MNNNCLYMNKPNTIKHNLINWITQNGSIYEFHNTDVLIDELCFLDRKNRADLVYANGQLTAFEIKSSADNLSRWEQQYKAYLKVFDAVWLCCHYKHVFKAIEFTPKYIGIIVTDDSDSGIAVLRKAGLNKKVDPYFLLDLLWRSELNELCIENKIPVRRKEKIKEAQLRIARELPVEVIKKKVIDRLKTRYKEKLIYSISSSS